MANRFIKRSYSRLHSSQGQRGHRDNGQVTGRCLTDKENDKIHHVEDIKLK